MVLGNGSGQSHMGKGGTARRGGLSLLPKARTPLLGKETCLPLKAQGGKGVSLAGTISRCEF